MNIFSTLMNKIFNRHELPSQPNANPARHFAPTPSGFASDDEQPVDVIHILTEMAGTKGQKLNWRESIVDLMKLVELDSSYENRVALAKELNYDGDFKDSAKMNIWLHSKVMEKLAQNNGKFPDSMKH